MLAPLDSPANGSTTPGGSRETLISSRAPQGSVTAASPQYIGETSITPHTAAESPYRMPTTPSRSPRIQSSEYSPSVNYPQAYSPTMVPSYVPTPSPTPSQRGAYTVPAGFYNNKNNLATHSTTTDGPSQQYISQQAPYQQSYLHHHQAYPDPVVHAYPDPTLVNTPITAKKPTKPALASTEKPKSTGRRKNIIKAMAFITIILLAVVVYLVLSMKKNKDSSSSSSSSTPSSGDRVQAPPIPPYTFEKGHCPSFFCNDYYHITCKGECKKDSIYQTCKNGCNGEQFCTSNCERGQKCFDDCITNLGFCHDYCFR
ncbi:hypothetical protein K457DRAFT_142825 [Linnemannia elongata AG-77]|uniref:Uncharacterized protein n=1 Tax=Linnemannia elongata AG-77 TaxID=1314771 RepID=A0A197JDW2_9FUNG|nr:hypothetical protein K457DRAFT_142825 [Linnemannia elongata AG-77]